MFIQAYRLLSTYSSIKPPRGSNVGGAGMLQVLVELKDCHGPKRAERRMELESMIDIILDGNVPFQEEEMGDLDIWLPGEKE